MEKKKLNISCDTVTLSVFMDCLFDDNYTALAPEATYEQRKELWRKLSDEYSHKSGNMKQQYIFAMMRKIAMKEAKLAIAELAGRLPEKEATTLLKGIGYTGGKLHIESRIRNDMVMLETQKNELKNMMNNESKEQGASRSDFIGWITVVSKYMGYRIDPVVTTITEFLGMDKMMKDSINSQKKKV